MNNRRATKMPEVTGELLSAELASTWVPPVRHALVELADRYEPGLVSIIIPCYDNAPYIAEAIQSALDQTYQTCEIIVIDDGSTDGSWDIIESFGSRVTARRRAANGGACVARNDGLELACGEYIQFLDADDFLFPSSIADLIQGRKFDPQSLYGNWINVNQRGEPLDEKTCGGNGQFRTFRDELEHWIAIFAILHHRTVLYRLGGFDESLMVAQDRDLHFRLRISGVSLTYVPAIVGAYRQHGSSNRISALHWSLRSEKLSDVFPRLNHHLRLARSSGSESIVGTVEQFLATVHVLRGRIAAAQGNRLLCEAHHAAAKWLAGLHPALLNRQPMWILGRLFGRYRVERCRLALRRAIGQPCVWDQLWTEHQVRLQRVQ